MQASAPWCAPRLRSAACVVAALCAGCGAVAPPASSAGPVSSVRVELVAGSGGPALTRVHVDLAPAAAGADLALDPATRLWTGTLAIPANAAQTVSATAWSGATAVGSATATVTVAQHATGLVALTLLDTTQRPPGADHGPVLTAIVASEVTPTVGLPVTLRVSAVDPDRDGITWAWRDACGGSFSPASAATTAWTPAASGSCAVTASATSRGITASKALRFTVSALPPVTIVEDGGYASSGDPLSTYAYRLADGSYAELIDEGTAAFAAVHDEVRLARYVVANSGASPVAVKPPEGPTWSLIEYWTALPPARDTGLTATGTTCESLAPGFTLAPACAVDEAYVGALGDVAALGATCAAAVEPMDEIVTAQLLTITSRAYALADDGTEGAEAAQISGQFVVPAAAGAVPGRIAIYLVRPVARPRRAAVPLWNGGAWVATREVWRKLGPPTWTGTCSDSGDRGESGAPWGQYEWKHLVDAAEDRLSGTFTFTAYHTSGGVLQSAPVPMRDVDVSRVIPH